MKGRERKLNAAWGADAGFAVAVRAVRPRTKIAGPPRRRWNPRRRSPLKWFVTDAGSRPPARSNNRRPASSAISESYEPMKPKLIIVTDLGLFRAYRLEATPKKTPHLELLQEVNIEEAHQRLTDKVTDLSGRHVSPTARKWGAPLSDDHNLKLETKRRLVRTIADHIKRLVHANPGTTCCLAAHKEINHLIWDALPQPVRARIETNLGRDLVKATRRELLEIFAPSAATPKSRPAPEKSTHP